jgi:hypothetical protein
MHTVAKGKGKDTETQHQREPTDPKTPPLQIAFVFYIYLRAAAPQLYHAHYLLSPTFNPLDFISSHVIESGARIFAVCVCLNLTSFAYAVGNP